MKSCSDITRRDFLKTVGLAAATATFGCATTEKPKPDMPPTLAATKPDQVIYPKLPESKIQPPENGCLVGFYKQYWTDQNSRREYIAVAEKAKDQVEMWQLQEALRQEYDKQFLQKIKQDIDEFRTVCGKGPFAYVLADTPKLYNPFPESQAALVSEQGIVPFIHGKVDSALPKHCMSLSDIIKGKYDKLITNFAKGAIEFGETHGGFFIMTMPEPNGNWFYWNSSKFVPAWRHIWQIFEDQGANQYATWVWKPYCPEASMTATDPEPFYPGDKYVDWIGLSAVSKLAVQGMNRTFEDMIPRTYERMRKDHPQKPLMQSEFGRTDNYDQPNWLRNAYKNIKNEFPAMKAAIYYGFPGFGHDSTLNQKSLQTLGDIFKDPY